MTTLDEHEGIRIVKGLILGDPGGGKTGSLASLVAAGYKLRILDFDNLLSPLGLYVRLTCPDKIKNVEYVTLMDKLKGGPGGVPAPDGTPKTFATAMGLMDKWTDGTDPHEWGQDTILVLDSLTNLSRSCHRWATFMNPGVGQKGGPDPRQIFRMAQDMVLDMLATLSHTSYKCHVLVLAHIDYDTDHLGVKKGYPRTIGIALNSIISGSFNTVVLCQSEGLGGSTKRVIRTNPTGIVDLKNPLAVNIPDSLPLETGLASIFQAVKQQAGVK